MSKLSEDNILELLDGISDRQAIDSDFGGDSDAEDAPCFERKSIGQKNRIKMNTFIHDQSSYYTSSPLHSNTSCDEFSISNSSNISKLSRLRPKRPKSAVNSDVSLQDPDLNFDDSDDDPTYEPILNKDTLGNILADNNDEVLNDILNISEQINTDNVDSLINFIENSDSEDYFDVENDTFQFSKNPPFTTLTYNAFNFNNPYGPNVFVDTKSPLKYFSQIFINILLINQTYTQSNVVKI